jgi:hypothetical protein
MFSDHLKRSNSFDMRDLSEGAAEMILNIKEMEANRSTGARCRPRGSSIISFRNSVKWEGEPVYD